MVKLLVNRNIWQCTIPYSTPLSQKLKFWLEPKFLKKIQTQIFFWFFGFSWNILLESSKLKRTKIRSVTTTPLNEIWPWNDLLRSNPGQVHNYLTILFHHRTDFGNNSLQKTVESQSPQNIFTKIHLSFIQNVQNCK